jgi:hypothetical protein
MASQQVLSLVISAIDKASGVLGRVSGAVKGLGGSADQSAVKQDNLGNIISTSMLKAQIAISGVQSAYGKLTSAITEASQIELENLNAASGLEQLVGDYDKAAKMVGRISKELAVVAGPLPGNTGDYVNLFTGITDDIGNAFKGTDGRIADLDAYEKTIKSISTSFGAISATGGKGIQNMQLALTRYFSGATLKEVMNIDSFGANPRLRTALEEAVKKSGKDLQDMTDAERVKLLEQVGSSIITPEYLARAQNTLASTWQTFVSGLFDSRSGLFGVLKDLDNQMEGDQTVYESAKATVNALIGNDGMFAQISGIFSGLGLTTDPMVQLKKGIDRLNGFLNSVSKFLNGVKSDIAAGGFSFDGGNLAGEFGARLGQLANQGIAYLSQIDLSAAMGQAGAMLAQGFNFLAGAALSFLSTVDLPTFLGVLVSGLFRGIYGLFANLSWQTYAVIAGGFLVAALVPGVLTFAGGLVATFLGGTVGLPLLLVAAAAFAIGSLAKVVIDNWSTISAMAGDLFGSIGQALKGAIELALGVVTMNGGLIVSGLSNLFQGVTGWLDKARDTWATLTGGKTSGEQRAESSYAAADEWYKSAYQKKFGTMPTDTVLAKFNGHIPNASGGLLGAAARESAAMPTGSQVVVANDSEYILKPTGRSASPGGGNTYNFYVNGDNAKAIAQQVLGIIQQQFDDEVSAQLA